MDDICKGLTQDECEVTYVRQATDIIEKQKGKSMVDSKEIERIIHILETFLKSKKLLCYGGTAINNLLPEEDQFYDKTSSFPDYDFFSPNALEDAKKLSDLYLREGFTDIEAKSGVHHGTYKVFVNYIPVADVTFLDKEIYENLHRESIRIQGIYYCPPNYLRMSMYLELSRPEGDVKRWEKVIKRLQLLNKHYPIQTDSTIGCKHTKKLLLTSVKNPPKIQLNNNTISLGRLRKQLGIHIKDDANMKVSISDIDGVDSDRLIIESAFDYVRYFHLSLYNIIQDTIIQTNGIFLGGETLLEFSKIYSQERIEARKQRRLQQQKDANKKDTRKKRNQKGGRGRGRGNGRTRRYAHHSIKNYKEPSLARLDLRTGENRVVQLPVMNTNKLVVRSIPFFDVLSENRNDFMERTLNALQKKHQDVLNKLKNTIKLEFVIKKYESVGEVIPGYSVLYLISKTAGEKKSTKRTLNDEEITNHRIPLVYVFDTLACHGYNVIKRHNHELRIASFDTLMSFYLAFLYSPRSILSRERILCMAEILFGMMKYMRNKHHSLFKRFTTTCYGSQDTLGTIMAERAKKYEELRDKLNRTQRQYTKKHPQYKKVLKEFESWFLRYIPS